MNQKHTPSQSAHLLLTTEYRAIWLVIIIGVTLSMAALWLIRGQLEAHKKLEFEWVVHNRIRAINHGIDNGLLAIADVRDYFEASETVEPRAFQKFAESKLERHQEIYVLMWVPESVLSDNAGGVEGAPTDQTHGYILSDRDNGYYPVTAIAPSNMKNYPPGIEFGSSMEFSKLLKRVRDNKRMSASGRIAFHNGKQEIDNGIVVALPVFGSRSTEETRGQESSYLQGFIVGLFRLSDIARASISLLEPRGVEVLLIDETADLSKQFLHFYTSRLAPRAIDDEDFLDWWRNENEQKLEERISVADRQWVIISGQTDHFRSAEAFTQSPWVVLITGLLFTLLLAFYLERIRENDHQRLVMEQRLMEREELFRQMTETVDEAFWATTADGYELIYISPAHEKITGLAERDMQTTLLTGVHPEDRSILSDALHAIREQSTDIEVIYRIQRTDGVWRWLRTKGFSVLDETGEVVRIVGFSEDITERKLADEAIRESEAKLRDLFQQSPDIIMTVDSKGTILLMNRSIPALPAERAVGRNSLALMPHGFRKWYRRALQAVFSKSVTRVFQYSTHEGIYWEGRIVPISGDGPVTAAMVIATDVTEKRNLEQQTLRNARLASIGVLSAGVAHEINNPNNSIQFNASLVARAWKDIAPILTEYYEENGDFALGGLSFYEAQGTLPKLLSDITDNSERIRRIVLNLKHMARQDAGEHTEEVDIQQVLETSMMILHNQIQKHTDTCMLNVPEELPPLKGNAQQLEQVFINVLLNALQSLPDRSRGVYIDAFHRPESECLYIEVRDEGRGVSERDMGRLTEPFFTTRKETGGTGLGLSISRSIMEKHGGRLLFKSKAGEGTKVTICIPCVG